MKNKIVGSIFIIFISSFGIINIFLPDKDISISERRKLATFPDFTLSSEWIEKVDKYLLDQFIFRDGFRSLKATYNYKVLQKIDNNNISIKDDYIFKSNYPTNKDSIDNFNKKNTKLSSLLSDENKQYLMIIPDKNYYYGEGDFLQLDYDYIYEHVELNTAEIIDIRDVLSLGDYYKTDTHWKQERLSKVVERMNEKMQFGNEKTLYKKHTYDNFYGVYVGESAIKSKGEKLTYLTNDIIDNAKVLYLENPKLTSVYNEDKLTGLDSYEVYLDGASSFIEIYNYEASTEKELVIFRDSFGSSLAPLLVDKYKKITIIDNRYITSEIFTKYIKFTNQDVLFMYSTLIVNESGSLKG